MERSLPLWSTIERLLLIFYVFFAIVGFAGCTVSSKSSAISYPKQNSQTQAVLAPAYFQKLEEQPYITHGPRGIKAVALTFDADMTPHMLELLKSGKDKSLYDQRIVQTLRSEHVPATIFTTGMWAETYPQALQSFAQDKNFEIENHSYDHAAFTLPCYGLGMTQNPQLDITKAQDVIMKISGLTPKFFRFPGGCFEEKDLELVHSLGLIPIQWDVISGDAFLKNPASVVHQVITQAQPGSIIIFHLNGAPNAPATAEALPQIIKILRAKGYTFMTLENLLQDSN